MRFLAGLFLGMLLAGPQTVEHYYNTDERWHLNVTVPPATTVYEVVDRGPMDDADADCIIEHVGGYGGDWTAEDVVAVLDEAWAAGVSPCELEERE